MLFILIMIITNFCPLLSNNNCLVYANNQQELVVIDDNKLTYRLNNGGGLITFTYFSGDYVKKKNKLMIGCDKLVYLITEEREENTNNNFISICLKDNDNKPINYAPIVFNNSSLLIEQNYYSDENGCIKINSNLFNESPVCLNMNVLLLGNTFNQSICVKKGNKYSIKLLVPVSLGIQNSEGTKRKYLKIVPINEDSTKIYDPNLRVWKYFNRLDNSSECHGLIFNIN